jgi:hypothetical protein
MMRRQLMQDIFDSVVGAGRVSASGIVDVTQTSRDVNYDSLIAAAKTLIIGEHYSSRFFEDYSQQIQGRLSRKQNFTAVLLKPETLAEQYLTESHSGRSGPARNLALIRELMRTPPDGKPMTLKFHARVLRYSFVLTDELVWVRFFTNSEGYSLVPAICFAKGTGFYDFFQTDVDRLLEQSEDDHRKQPH